MTCCVSKDCLPNLKCFGDGSPTKLDIFGGAEEMAEWRDTHPSRPNCAMKEWRYLGACSEYDYLFVNTDGSSTEFGATRRITNNCFVDEEFLPAPFDNFFDLVEEWMEKYVGLRKENEGDDDWQDDIHNLGMSFLEYKREHTDKKREQ